MTLIPIYKGGVVVAHAKVDADMAHLAQWRWSLDQHGYARRTVYISGRGNKGSVFMHRLVLGLDRSDGRVTDHIDGDKLDNRRAKLRAVTNSQNQQNRRGAKRGNSTGLRGVCKGGKGYRAYCGNTYLGYFSNPLEAAEVADRARREAGYLEGAA